MLDTFSILSFRLLTFFCSNVFFHNISVSNYLNLDLDQRFVGPDMGQYCLQTLSATQARKELKNVDNYVCGLQTEMFPLTYFRLYMLTRETREIMISYLSLHDFFSDR